VSKSIGAATADLALALAEKYFPEPKPTIGHAVLLLSGRMNTWQEYPKLPEAAKVEIAKLWQLRARGWENEHLTALKLLDFLRGERKAFDEGESAPGKIGYRLAVPVDSDEYGRNRKNPRGLPFESQGGLSQQELIDASVRELQAARKYEPTFPEANSKGNEVRLESGLRSELQFVLRVPELPAPPEWPEVVADAMTGEDVSVAQQDVMETARALADADSELAYVQGVVERFLGSMQKPGSPHLSLSALEFACGTQTIVAPTGSGKNVLAEVLILTLVRSGKRVTLSMPTIDRVLEQSCKLERFAALLGLDVTVAAMFSQDRVAGKTMEALERDPELQGEAQWMLERFGYACSLSAYAVEGAVVTGDEPCRNLRQVMPDGKTRRVDCPFLGRCGKHDYFERAAYADVIVVNHHALLMGQMPIPAGEERPSLLELILRRSDVVLIDEVDELQGVALANSVDEMGIAALRDAHVSTIKAALHDFENSRHYRQEPDRLRPVVGVDRVGSLLLGMLDQHLLQWKQKRNGKNEMLMEGSLDHFLVTKLFPHLDNGLPALDALYDNRLPPPAGYEALAEATSWFGDYRMRDAGDTDRGRVSDLRRELKNLRLELDSRDLKKLGDWLILRGMLTQISDYLGYARERLTNIAGDGSKAAQDLRQGFGGFSAWSLSPFGPLGRQVYGFEYDPRDISLSAQALRSDPHGMIAELGGDVSRALAGSTKPVVGLSATAYFPGSPKNDVLAAVTYFVPDESGRVQVHNTPVEADPISGKFGSQRKRNLQDAVKELAEGYLKPLLARQEGRADAERILLVVGSYEEARTAARTLADALGGNGTQMVRYVERNLQGASMEISKVDIERFAEDPHSRVLIAPRNVISRGHNILQRLASTPIGRQLSAIRHVFMVIRPVPPMGRMDRGLAHVTYNSRRKFHPTNDPVTSRESERIDAERHFRKFRGQTHTLMGLDTELRQQVFCDVLVELLQIIGRARRGDTSVDLYFVDSAFATGHVSWQQMFEEAYSTWHDEGELELMTSMHRSLLEGLTTYAGLKKDLIAS
jgi:hypothetical protein